MEDYAIDNATEQSKGNKHASPASSDTTYLLFKEILDSQNRSQLALSNLQIKVSELVNRDNCASSRKDIYEKMDRFERTCSQYEETKATMAKTEDIKDAIADVTKGLVSKEDFSGFSKHLDDILDKMEERDSKLERSIMELETRVDNVEMSWDNLKKFLKNNKALTVMFIMISIILADVTLGRVHDGSYLAIINWITSMGVH